MMHLTWISFLLMGAGMRLFMRSLSKAGVEHSALTRPASELHHLDHVQSFCRCGKSLAGTKHLTAM